MGCVALAQGRRWVRALMGVTTPRQLFAVVLIRQLLRQVVDESSYPKTNAAVQVAKCVLSLVSEVQLSLISEQHLAFASSPLAFVQFMLCVLR